MSWIFKTLVIGSTAFLFYLGGYSFGALQEKGYVSVYDLKKAIASLIRDVQELGMKVDMLMRENMRIRAEIEELRKEVSSLSSNVRSPFKVLRTTKNQGRVRLSPWGKVIGTVPKGTNVVVLEEFGEWYITNLGYMHKSLFEEAK